jgi:hypothetical protein
MKMSEEEVWKTVPNYPDYEVSSLGRVRSHRTGSPKLLKGHLNRWKGRSRKQFSLYRGAGGEKNNVWLDTLVMGTFVGPTPAGYFIKHKDEDALNSALDNLVFAPIVIAGGRPKGRRNFTRILNEVQAILKSDDPGKVDQACQLIQRYLSKKGATTGR